jgi:hypothetical protein
LRLKHFLRPRKERRRLQAHERGAFSLASGKEPSWHPFGISAVHRNALREEVLISLSGIGDVAQALEGNDFSRSYFLAQSAVDELRLLLNDLGLDNSADGPAKLTMERKDLKRALSRIRARTLEQQATEAEEQAEANSRRERARLVVEVCDQVLTRIESGADLD